MICDSCLIAFMAEAEEYGLDGTDAEAMLPFIGADITDHFCEDDCDCACQDDN